MKENRKKYLLIIIALVVLSIPTYLIYTRFCYDIYEIKGTKLLFQNSTYSMDDSFSSSLNENLGETVGIAVEGERTFMDYIFPNWIIEYKNDKAHNRLMFRGLMSEETYSKDLIKTKIDETDKLPNQLFNSGILLGLNSLNEEEPIDKDNPQPLKLNYKTIWISLEGSKIKYKQKDGMIIAPSKDGFYEYKSVDVQGDSKKRAFEGFLTKLLSYKAGTKYLQPQIDSESSDMEYLMFYSEAQNLLYVGNNYSLVYIDSVYTTGAGGYQYVPSIELFEHGKVGKSWMEKGNNPKANDGLQLLSLFDSKTKANIEKQIQSYKKKYNKTVKEESDHDRVYISEDNLSLERRNGKWTLLVPIMFSNWKDSHNFIKDFKEINCKLPSSLTSWDQLPANWSELKKVEPDMVDAISSPKKDVLVVQTKTTLKVYDYKLFGKAKPLLEIPLKKNERIVMNQWATGNYVTKWDSELNNIMK